MTIRLTDVARELIAAGLHGEQLLDAMGRIESLASAEITEIKSERATGVKRAPPERTEESGQRIINSTPTTREPGVDELHE